MIALSTQPSRELSPEVRTALYYSTIFLGSGLIAVYAGLWMEGKGLTPGQIGVVNAVPLALMLGLNWVVGRLADRAGDWRGTVVWAAWIAAAAVLAFFAARGFWGVLVVWTLYTVPHSAAIPVLDAAAMRMTRRRGTGFGGLRAWGTVGYLVVLLVAGSVMQALGQGAFVPLLLGLALVRAVTALALPRFRAPPGEEATPGARRIREVLKPWFLLPLAGWSAVFATHVPVNAFQGILWQGQGIGCR